MNSHNPVMNRMLPDAIRQNQAEVDAQFDSIVTSQKMTQMDLEKISQLNIHVR